MSKQTLEFLLKVLRVVPSIMLLLKSMSKFFIFHSFQQSNFRKAGYGRSSDVWSIGCTVLEMITGKLPWTKGGKILQDISILYQLREKNDPLKYHGEIMEFTGYPFFAQNSKTFLKA